MAEQQGTLDGPNTRTTPAVARVSEDMHSHTDGTARTNIPKTVMRTLKQESTGDKQSHIDK